MSAEWISVIATIILVIITTYYAVITHRIMNLQNDITELEYRPFLKLENIQLTKLVDDSLKEINGIRIGMKLNNVGRVLLKYQINKMVVSIEGKSNKDTVFLNNGGYVYPGQIIDFTYSDINIDGEVPDVLQGIFEYELIYFSTEKKKYKSYRKYAIFIYNKSNYIEWKSLEEDEKEE